MHSSLRPTNSLNCSTSAAGLPVFQKRRSEDIMGSRTIHRPAGQHAAASHSFVLPRLSLDSARLQPAIASSSSDGRRSAAANPDWISPAKRMAAKKSTLELSMICREVDLLCRFKSDCVVNLLEYYVSSTGQFVHLVLEFLGGGTLADELQWRHLGRGYLSENEARVVARRVRFRARKRLIESLHGARLALLLDLSVAAYRAPSALALPSEYAASAPAGFIRF